MSLAKDKRWQNKDYLKFVSEMPCSNCSIIDGTVVAHHLKHRYSPWGGGGMGLKASDILTMPLCYDCHSRAQNGDGDILDFQAPFIFKALDAATKHDVISITYKPYEYYKL